jgi:predicted nucleic acid-binding protein
VILVDSSVWIDVLADRETLQTVRFRELLAARQEIGIADLVAVEVLQGTRNNADFVATAATLDAFSPMPIMGDAVVTAAAQFYRRLRALGVTPRKTIDTLIATRCILDTIPLLFADRDFLPFVEHLGLRSALDDTGLT